MLTLAFAALTFACAPGWSEGEWEARLDFTRVDFQLNFNCRDADLGIDGSYDIGFGSDAQQLYDDARSQIERSEYSGRTFHQLMYALLRLDRGREIDGRMIGAMVDLYARDVEAEPDSAVLRVASAQGHVLCFRITNDARLYDLAQAQFAEAALLDATDWRISAERTELAVIRFERSLTQAGFDWKFYEAASEFAEAAIAVAPRSIGPRWRMLVLQQTRVSAMARTSKSIDGPIEAMEQFVEYCDEVTGAVGGFEDGALLRFAAQGYALASASSLAIMAGARRGQELASKDLPYSRRENFAVLRAALVDGGVVERVERALASMKDAERSELIAGVSRCAWTALVLAGHVEKWQETLQRVAAFGAEREPALASLLMAEHLLSSDGDERKTLARIEAVLAAEATDDIAFRALLRANDELGRPEQALSWHARLTEATAADSVDHAVLLLRAGEHANALAMLEELVARTDELSSANAAIAAHARGVALARAGRYADAVVALEAALAEAPDRVAVEATLEEVRALAQKGR